MAHELPPLPYAYDALEPVIDKQTMTIHHDLPEHGVVDVAAAVVLDDLAYVFGDAGEVLEELLRRFLADLGVLLYRAVQIGDVGLVVLVVVELHRGFVDGGLKRRVIVWQRW